MEKNKHKNQEGRKFNAFNRPHSWEENRFFDAKFYFICPIFRINEHAVYLTEQAGFTANLSF